MLENDELDSSTCVGRILEFLKCYVNSSTRLTLGSSVSTMGGGGSSQTNLSDLFPPDVLDSKLAVFVNRSVARWAASLMLTLPVDGLPEIAAEKRTGYPSPFVKFGAFASYPPVNSVLLCGNPKSWYFLPSVHDEVRTYFGGGVSSRQHPQALVPLPCWREIVCVLMKAEYVWRG